MKQKTSHTLFSYWNDVRGERMAPRRFEIEPARIAAILPETFILERLDSETFIYRLAGTRLCEDFGTEFRGTNFLDGWSEDDHRTIALHLAQAAAIGGVVVLEVEAAAADPIRPKVIFELALMPLVHTSATVSRLLGSSSAIDPPAWLGAERLVSKRLVEHYVLWPEGRPHAIADKYRNQAPLIASLAGARLVKSERRSFRVLDGGLTKAEEG